MISFYLRAVLISISLISFGAFADSTTTSSFPYTYSVCQVPGYTSNWGDWVDNCTASGANRYCALIVGCEPGKQSVKYRTSPPQCPEGEEWEAGTTNCITVEPPLDCGNGLTITNPDGTDSCLDPAPEPEECNNTAGNINGYPVCMDNENQCAAEGGSYGCYTNASGQLVCGCVSGGTEPPTCSSSGVVIITEDGYVCESPDDPTKPPSPNDKDGDGIPDGIDDDDDNDGVPDSEDSDADGDGQPDTDTDGDGVPDYADSDIDGDGIPNSQDPDADGDGVADDKTGPCDPSMQNYAACIGIKSSTVDSTGMTENISDSKQGELVDSTKTTGEGHINDAADSIIDDIENTVSGGDVIDGPDDLASKVNSAFAFTGGCSDMNIVTGFYTLSITCEGTSLLRTLLFWVLNIITVIFVFSTATRKVPE